MTSENILPDFIGIISEDFHVVDKSLFVKEFMNCKVEVFTILRPQGFGKSTNLSMLRSFLSIGANPANFSRFEIGKPEHKSFVKNHCGKYPVIYLDFKDCRGRTWEEMSFEIIKAVMVSLPDLDLSKHDPRKLTFLKSNSTVINEFSSILLEVTMTLSKLYKSKIIVLIDNFDTPLFESCKMGYYKDAQAFFESFYSIGLDNNKSIKKACLMGMVEVRCFGLFSGFSSAMICSVADNYFSTSFGFTKVEISKFLKEENARSNIVLTEVEFKQDLNKIFQWYSGYTIGVTYSIINPGSFVSWLRESREFKSYLVNTALTESIKYLFELCVLTGQERFSNLIGYGPMFTVALGSAKDFSLEPYDLKRTLHFLVLTGYLSYRPTSKKDMMSVYIPNREIKVQWQMEIIKMISRTTDYIKLKKQLYQLLTGRPMEVEHIEMFLREYFISSFSFFEFKNDKSYLVALLSFFRALFLYDEDVFINSHIEAGHGKYDILFDIQSMNRVVCIEIKYTKDPDALKATAVSALQRIKDRKYTVDHRRCECILIGIAFSGKLMSEFEEETVLPDRQKIRRLF